MALPALAIPAAAARVVAAVLKHGQARAIERFGTDAVRAAVAHIRRLQVSREDPDRPGATPGKPPPTRTRKATKSDDPYMRKGGMYGKKTSMMKGGMYKGKMHSYVAGGKVMDTRNLKRRT